MFYAAQGCLAVMVLAGMVYVQKQMHYLLISNQLRHIPSIIWTTLCGMVKDVSLRAAVVNSTILLGSVLHCPQSTTDDMEMRMCHGGYGMSNEDIVYVYLRFMSYKHTNYKTVELVCVETQ